VRLLARTYNNAELAIACPYQITPLENRRLMRFSARSIISLESREKRATFDWRWHPACWYDANFAILPRDAMRSVVPTQRYDLVSRLCDFQVRGMLDCHDTLFSLNRDSRRCE
jgi:hypothetical protein